MDETRGSYRTTLIAISLLVLYFLGSIVSRLLYNLYRHPLAHIPGPKLAGATYLYQTYFSSRYYLHIADLHKKYGPVLRITPDEVHLTDPDNYELIYSVGSKYGKSTAFYEALSGGGYSSFAAGPPELHRIRRARLDPFFSRRSVLNLEYLVHYRAQKLLNIMAAKFSKNKAVDLHSAFRAISVDVITDYAFGESYNLLDRDDLGAEFFDMTTQTGPAWWFFQQFPSIQALSLSMPPALVKKMSSPLKQVLTLLEHAKAQVLAVKAKLDAGERVDKPCIFEVLLNSNDGHQVPDPDQIKDEAFSILNAAADTTGNALSVAAYNVLLNPEIYHTLTAELKAAFPKEDMKLEFLKLEKLPYLTAIIKEGLRLSFGVPGRLPRVVPPPGATFNGYFLPAGSIVSMSSWILHQDEKYFPDGLKFDPTRWLDPQESHRIDKYLVAFGKGSRSCVGINLAYCELYVTLGTMFRHYDNLKPNDLTEEDLFYNDYFSSQHPVEATKFHAMKGDD